MSCLTEVYSFLVGRERWGGGRLPNKLAFETDVFPSHALVFFLVALGFPSHILRLNETKTAFCKT
jgi:hypothetical protein